MNTVPVLFSLVDAAAYIGFSRTRLYSELDRLDVRKVGRRTMITRASLDALVQSLPKKRSKPTSHTQPGRDRL